METKITFEKYLRKENLSEKTDNIVLMDSEFISM